MTDSVEGFVVQYEDDKTVAYLDGRLMWKDSSKPTDVEPKDRDVLPQTTLDLVRTFIHADKWNGPIPQKLYPAKWTPDGGVEITGEPTEFTID